MAVRFLGTPIMNRILARRLSLTTPACGSDAREKRMGHVKKSDKLEGEYASLSTTNQESYELIDENLMERLFDNVKFKDIPIVFITCTRNNTKICLTDGAGKAQTIKSAGTEGFKNCRKGTTVAAQAVASRVLTFAEDHDITTIRLVFNGLGPGRAAAYRQFELSKLKIISLSDRTEAIEPWVNRPRARKSI